MLASRLALIIGCGLFSASIALGAGAPKSHWPKTLEAFQGDVVEIKVSGDDLAQVEGSMGKEKIYFYPAGNHFFSALIGVDVEAKPSVAKLGVKVKSTGGAQRQTEIHLKIKEKSFHKESFNVPPSFDQMSPETLAEIRREQEAFARAFATTAPERFWDIPFIRPVPQDASASSFGSRRIINGVARAPHTGTDLSAPAGTEVVATNHGRVALVGDFFFAGGSVVLDHGGGLFSMYLHLSEFKVEEGALVRKGDVLALSGDTGRVTGPHLHWGVRLNNTRVDPLDLLRKFSGPSENSLNPSKAASKSEE
jgi:murein DD-endopeptidase MepM/ murein hydrolase activator NlpD